VAALESAVFEVRRDMNFDRDMGLPMSVPRVPYQSKVMNSGMK